MKHLRPILLLAAIAALFLCAVNSVSAQDTPPPTAAAANPEPGTRNPEPGTQSPEPTPPTWYARALSFNQGVESNRSLTLAVYPSYAPALKVEGQTKPWGFGAAALYPLGAHAFTGFRADYLAGDFFAGQADVGGRANFQLFGKNFTTFAVTGVLLPVQGAGDSNFKPGWIVGGGVSCRLHEWQTKTGTAGLDIAYEGERWQVPGTPLDGIFVHHLVAAFNWKF